ncbi:sulfotransferase [Marinomonas sp. GJ51-6]|uniref:sulfotransferase n=1 Tax=Marinomonas sp. GJ51-6 TaxID=2992802 RepID=UPI00293423E0|nr:sulfotransferase [Marinomonas sp. GJ51-6]WOD06171.1 sulfotransferase [Marinomonas sp. GJ51-6]
MSSSFELFKQQIDGAVALIEQTDTAELNDTNIPATFEGLVDTHSLLARCEAVCKEYKEEKPTIRVIHHFACSGGTLVSKCLSAIPNVFLLSEVHPLSKNHASGKPKYLPSDITTLARYAGVPSIEELASKLFTENIITTHDFIESRGGVLILREHTHIDYCIGTEVVNNPVVENILSPYFDLKHVVTVRNPIDSYMSLVKAGWVQFLPATFDEYCKRFLAFISHYPEKSIFKYEDFVEKPDKQLKKICHCLELEFDEEYLDIFDIFSVTGDSGRKSSDIAKRERYTLDVNFLSEIEHSENFKKILKKLKYEKDFE